MVETLCLRNEPLRYVVVAGDKIKYISHSKTMADAVNRDIMSKPRPEDFWLVVEEAKINGYRK